MSLIYIFRTDNNEGLSEMSELKLAKQAASGLDTIWDFGDIIHQRSQHTFVTVLLSFVISNLYSFFNREFKWAYPIHFKDGIPK